MKGPTIPLLAAERTALNFLQRLSGIATQAARYAARAEPLGVRIADTRKRLTELTAQSSQPYEYEDRLAALSLRQQEIADALDLTKSQASSQMAAEEQDERVTE